MALTTVAGDAGESNKTHDFGPAIWAAVLLAIVATVALTVAIVTGGDDSASVPGQQVTDGSGTLFNPYASDAIERRALAELRIVRASESVSERGGINAVEHRALARAAAGVPGDTVTETAIEQGSPDAAEHRGAGG